MKILKLSKTSIYPLLAIVMMTAGCKDEPTAPAAPSTHFSPPAWIQGTWNLKGSSSPLYTFTSDDFVHRFGNEAIYQSQNAFINSQNEYNPGAVSVSVQSSDDQNYNFTLVTSSTSGNIYQFKKISESEMEWANSPQKTRFTKR